MNPLELLQTSASERFAWCLLHFVWQGTVLAAIAWVCASGFGRSNARVRYALNVTCLLAMVVCVAVTYVLAAVPGETSFAEASSDRSFAPMPEPGAMPITDMGSELPVLTGAISPPGQTSDLGPDKVAPFSIDSVQWRRYLPYAMVIYWLGVTGMLVRLIIGLQGGQRLRRLSRPVDEEFILKTLAAQACTLGLSYVPAVAYCGRIAVPVVVGVVRPTILLPLALAANLTPEQVEMLLVHELAHIRRLDPLVNVLQRIIEAVLFFHPAVWFVSHRIRIEREHCCDDLVVRAGGRAEAYASSLLAVAQRAIHAPKLPEAMAVVKKTSRLRVRIRRILGLDPADSLRLRHFWLTVPLFVLAGMLIVDSHIQAKELSAPDALAEELAPGFNIYLLKDETLTWDDCNDTPLQDLELQAKPWIRSEDIDRYHASSHCMTLKTPRPFPLNRISLRGTPFVVTVGDRRCYLGAVTARGLLSPFSDDSIPIIYLAGHQSDVVTIVLRGINRPTSPSDVRADRGILAALKDMGVYDVGLSMSLDHVEVVSDINGASITYTYTLTNKGMNPLYVLDPDRMGNELFQRFHRPPFLHNTDLDRGFNRKKLGTVEPDLYTQYDPDWFTLIQPGHPITRTVKVGGYPACPPGKYACALFFHSPGRRFAGDKRTQFDAPVWIGTALGIKRFTMGQDSVSMDDGEESLVYEFVDIHPMFRPSAINAKGQVVGTLFSENRSSSQAAIWSTSDGMMILGTLPAPANLRSSATAINELGWVVGHSDEDGNRWRPFIWTAQEGMLPIPDLGGNQAPPLDIDNSGRVVGWSDTPSDGWRAFLYTPLAAIVNLGTLGGSYQSQASAINKQGWVVGNATVSAKVVMPHQEPMRAFLWRPSSGMVDLGVIPGYSDGVAASAINDKGTVVGNAIKTVKLNRPQPGPQPVSKVRARRMVSVTAYTVGRPFRWTEAHGIELLPTPEFDDVRAVTINNKDIVLLKACNIDDEHVIKREYSYYLATEHGLQQLPDYPGFQDTRYRDINDDGYLVGYALTMHHDESGNITITASQGFMATPRSN